MNTGDKIGLKLTCIQMAMEILSKEKNNTYTTADVLQTAELLYEYVLESSALLMSDTNDIEDILD